jgi:hypothetical protein
MNKKLTDLITKKLTELDKLLEEIKGYQIEPNDQEM